MLALTFTALDSDRLSGHKRHEAFAAVVYVTGLRPQHYPPSTELKNNLSRYRHESYQSLKMLCHDSCWLDWHSELYTRLFSHPNAPGAEQVTRALRTIQTMHAINVTYFSR